MSFVQSPNIKRRRVELYAIEAYCHITQPDGSICNGLMHAVAARGREILHRCDACGRDALYTEQFPRTDHVLTEAESDGPKIKLDL